MDGIKKTASENPAMAVAAGIGVGALIIATGGVALAGSAVAGVGLYGAYQYEDSLKEDVDKMSCTEAKELARRNYYGEKQKADLLSKACAQQKKSAQK